MFTEEQRLTVDQQHIHEVCSFALSTRCYDLSSLQGRIRLQVPSMLLELVPLIGTDTD